MRPPWVKVFERVPGATVQGQGPPNSSVAAAVEIQSPTTGSAFIYRQTATTDAQGNFEMTLPYSTTGYENFGPENGYTNVSARATGPYQFYETQSRENYLSPVFRQNSSNGDRYVYQTNASVSEGKVVGADSSPVQVTLEQRVIAQGQSPTTPDDGTDSTNTSSDGSTTDGTDGSTNTTDDNTSTQGSLVAPRDVVSP